MYEAALRAPCEGAGDILAITDKRTAEAGNRRRQTVLLSATLHSKLDSLASLSLQNPAAIGFQVQVSYIDVAGARCGMQSLSQPLGMPFLLTTC